MCGACKQGCPNATQRCPTEGCGYLFYATKFPRLGDASPPAKDDGVSVDDDGGSFFAAPADAAPAGPPRAQPRREAAAAVAYAPPADSVDVEEKEWPSTESIAFEARKVVQKMESVHLAFTHTAALRIWEEVQGRQRDFVVTFEHCRSLGRELGRVTSFTLEFTARLFQQRDTNKRLIFKLGITADPRSRAGQEYKLDYDTMAVLFAIDVPPPAEGSAGPCAADLAAEAEKLMILPFTLYRSVPPGVTCMNVSGGACGASEERRPLAVLTRPAQAPTACLRRARAATTATSSTARPPTTE